MDAAQARERQLVREAAIALTAIVLAVVGLCAVMAWKFELFSAVSNAPPPPEITSLSDLPEYAAMQRARAERERAAEEEELQRRRGHRPTSPTVVHAAAEPTWQPRGAAFVDYQSSVEATSTERWTPPESREAAVEWNAVVEPAADVGATTESNSLMPAVRERETSESSSPPPREHSLDAPRIAAEAPPAFRETTRPTGQQVRVAKRRMVAPFPEDDLPPDASEAEASDHAVILTAPATAGPTTAAPVREPSRPDSVVVAPGDSFFRIAERVYGDGEFYKALFEHNRARFPRAGKLPVGATVDTPPAEELQRLYPALAPPS